MSENATIPGCASQTKANKPSQHVAPCAKARIDPDAPSTQLIRKHGCELRKQNTGRGALPCATARVTQERSHPRRLHFVLPVAPGRLVYAAVTATRGPRGLLCGAHSSRSPGILENKPIIIQFPRVRGSAKPCTKISNWETSGYAHKNASSSHNAHKPRSVKQGLHKSRCMQLPQTEIRPTPGMRRVGSLLTCWKRLALGLWGKERRSSWQGDFRKLAVMLPKKTINAPFM
jgi:hypothetical protein